MGKRVEIGLVLFLLTLLFVQLLPSEDSGAASNLRPSPGPAPKKCAPPNSIPRTMPPPPFGIFAGKMPVWMHIYARYNGVYNTYRTQQAPHTKYGWRVKILWVLHRDQQEPVSVFITEVRTQRPVLFKIAGQGNGFVATKTRKPVLDPAQPGHPDDPGKPETHEWGSDVYFPRASCYTARAVVPGGDGWAFVFGFGR